MISKKQIVPGPKKILVEVYTKKDDDLISIDYSKFRSGKVLDTNKLIYFGPNFAVLEPIELQEKDISILVMEENNIYATVEMME